MKKYLLYILVAIALASCAKQPSFDPKAVAEQCMLEHAYHPEHLKVANGKVRPNVDQRLCLDFQG